MIVDTWLPRPKEIHEWMIHSNGPKLKCLKYMSQVFVKMFVQHAPVSQWHWPFKNTSCITITMERTSWCIGKHHSWAHQEHYRRACFRSRTASHHTIQKTFRVLKTASFWCSNFAAAPRLWAKRLKKLGASRRHFASPWKNRRWFLCTTLTKSKDVFCCKSMTEYQVCLSRSWNNAWGFPTFFLRRHRCDSGA